MHRDQVEEVILPRGSRLGSASVLVFSASVLLVAGWLLLYKELPGLLNVKRAETTLVRLVSAAIVAGIFTIGSATGFGLGLTGWLRKERPKAISVIGTVVNGLVVAVLVVMGALIAWFLLHEWIAGLSGVY